MLVTKRRELGVLLSPSCWDKIRKHTRWATIISHTHTWTCLKRRDEGKCRGAVLFYLFCSVFLNKPHRTVTQNAPRYSDPCGLLSLWSRSSFLTFTTWHFCCDDTVIKLAALFLKAVHQHTRHTTAALCGSRNLFFHPFGVPIRLGCAASALEED